MAINKPEQASTEMTKVLKSIADTIDGKSNTDCAATNEISKWTKYVGNKLAENSGSGGGSGTEIIPLIVEGTLMDMNMNDVSKSQLLDYLNDTSKIVIINNSIVQRVFRDNQLVMASCDSSYYSIISDGIQISVVMLNYQSSTLTLQLAEIEIKTGGTVTTQTTPIELS